MFSPLLVIGAGNMGGAILKCWLEAGQAGRLDLSGSDVFVEDPGPPAPIAEYLSHHSVQVAGQIELGRPPELVMVAVKPQIMAPVLEGLAPRLGPESLVLSIAAGKSLADLARPLRAGTPIVRMMPNTPVSLGAGMSVLVGNEFVTTLQRDKLESLLAKTGATAWIEDEALMDAVTAVSGSGPAYVFYLAECLAKAGVRAGLDEALALRLAQETIKGAGLLMVESDLPPSQLRANVTSKGGTTAAALEVLMRQEGGLEALIDEAIAAAAKRSKELSG